MSLFKGRLNSGGEFTAQDDVRGLRLIAPGSLPSYWSVECGDGVDWYFWVNDSDELIMDTSAPTSTYDSVGNIVTGAGNSGANKTLSNLGTTAINADILVDTDSTYDLGGTNYFALAYIDKIHVGSGATIAYGAATRIDFVGDEYHGVDAAGSTVTLYATTSGSKLVWDDTGNTNEGTLAFTDDAQLLFGDGSDILMEWTGNAMHIDASTDDYVLNFGYSKDLDIIFHGKTDTSDAGWDASVNTFQVADDAIFHIGGTGIGSQAVGFKFVFDGTATLNIDAITAQDSISIGENTVTDFELFGNAYDIIWDASEDELIYGDNVEVIWGAGKDLQIESTGTVTNFTMAATTGGIVVQPYAAATVAAIHIDGATNDWNGATGVGMLHISSDTALAHAAASNLLVTHATAAPITDADGFLARFVSTGTARTNGYAIDVVVTTTQPAMRLNSTVEITGVDTTANVLKLTGVDTTNNSDTVLIDHSGDGYAINIDLNEATSDGIKVEAFTNHTVPLILLDGDTAGFLGATDKGMLHIQNNIALANATASLLLIDNDTVKPINSALGYCFRIDDDAPVATTSPAWAAVIDSEDNCALKVIAQNVPDGKYAFEVSGTQVADTKSEGTAAYIQANLTSTDGNNFGTGIWTNITGTSSSGTIRALDVGVYTSSASNTTAVNINGISIDMAIDATNESTAIYPLRFNASGATVTGWFHAANANAVCMTLGDPGTADDAYITVNIGANQYRIPLVAV